MRARLTPRAFLVLLVAVLLFSLTANRQSGGLLVAYYLTQYDSDLTEPYSQWNDPTVHEHASVSWTTEYRLEDGTLVGWDNGHWDDRQNKFDRRLWGGDLTSGVAEAVSTAIGGTAGWQLGSWAAGRMRDAVAVFGAYSPMTFWGMATAAMAPYAGLAVGAAAGFV
jgi:hypothetical protein